MPCARDQDYGFEGAFSEVENEVNNLENLYEAVRQVRPRGWLFLQKIMTYTLWCETDLHESFFISSFSGLLSVKPK